jgi:hypothetical protein
MRGGREAVTCLRTGSYCYLTLRGDGPCVAECKAMPSPLPLASAAARLGVSVRTLGRLIAAGHLAVVQVSPRRVVITNQLCP